MQRALPACQPSASVSYRMEAPRSSALLSKARIAGRAATTVRAGRVPVTGTARSIVARAKAERRNIVLALDDSEEGWDAVHWTLDHLCRDDDTLHLLQVVPIYKSAIPFQNAMLACPPGDPELQAELEERANTFIKRHIDEYVAAGGGARKPSFVVEFVKGRAQRTLGAKICRISEALNAAVVVVAGHKAANVFEEWLMGSVSRHVATNCRQPTLVYPPFSSWPRG